MIKVLIAEDQKVLRESLKIILSQDQEVEVIGCAENGSEAVQIIERNLPDLVLMDIKMPVCDGIECTRIMKEKYPQIKILVLTTFETDDSVEKAIRNGADGFLLKDIGPDELIESIKTTINGVQIIHPNAMHALVKQLNRKPDINQASAEPISLTERELQIIKDVVQGKSNKDIAASLFLSESRVKNLISNILEKFNLKDRTQLAVYALRNNLID